MNWEWLDGIPYFVVTVEWASGKRRRKSMVKVYSVHSSWNAPDVKPDHSAGVCAHEFTGHVSAQMALPAFLHPNIQSQHEAKGENTLRPPPVSIPLQTQPTPWAILYLRRAEAPGLHFLLTSSLPRWMPALPRKRSVKARHVILTQRSTYWSVSLWWQNPKPYVSSFLFGLLKTNGFKIL